MSRTITAPTPEVTDTPESRRAFWLAYLREQRERADTPERIAERRESIARMRQIARGMEVGHSDGLPGAVVLIGEMDATRSDHICLAVAAHRLILRAAVDDLTVGGQPIDDESPRLLNLLSAYLDGCGWHWHETAMADDHSPQTIGEQVERMLDIRPPR